jgi:glycosyltransferase involved in cell wall biosynthesis
MPSVSVLMAVYNGERHLASAIDSILAQTHPDFEFIIVDDGSTDRSGEIIRRYADPRIRLITLDQNAGLSPALNAGLQTVTTPLVARQDADDFSEPTRLARQLTVMRARPSLALLGSRATVMTERGVSTGTVWRPVGAASIRWYGLFDNPFAHTSVMFKTSVVRDELGGYDPSFDPFSQDWALWCRLMERHDVDNLADRLVRYRVVPSSIIGALDGKDEEHRYRQRFGEIIRHIVSRHAPRTLGDGVINEAEALHLADFVLGVDEAHVPDFLALFERLLTVFCARHPKLRDSPDFLDTLAHQFDALAYRTIPPTRRSAIAVYRHALVRHPQVVRHLSWPRALSLAVLGKRGRGQLADLRRFMFTRER